MTALIMALLFSTHAHAAFLSHVHQADTPQPVAPFVFEDQNGGQQALSDFRGRYVLLNVWATWCGPCVEEMPSLDALQTRFDAKKLIVIPVSEDRNATLVAAFFRNHGLTHLPIALDHGGRIPAALNIDGVPTTLIIDPQGREIARVTSAVDWVSPDALAYLKEQLIVNAQ